MQKAECHGSGRQVSFSTSDPDQSDNAQPIEFEQDRGNSRLDVTEITCERGGTRYSVTVSILVKAVKAVPSALFVSFVDVVVSVPGRELARLFLRNVFRNTIDLQPTNGQFWLDRHRIHGR